MKLFLRILLLAFAAMLLSCKEKERGRDEPVKPEEVKLQILVADDAFSTLRPGESLQVAYEVKTPADVAYTLSSFQPEGWTVSISTPVGNKGKIGVSLPADASAGRIMLVADGSNGSCFVKVLGAGTGNDGTVEAYEAVDASGGSLELPSGAGTVHVSSSGDWLSVKGKQLLLSPNTAYDSREALVSFTVDKRECELTLVQAQKDAIVLTANALQAAAAGEILEFVVRANVDVQARCSDTWVKVTPSTKGLEDKPFRIELSPNDSDEIRSTVISFSSGGALKQELSLSQPPLPSVHTGDFHLLTDASILEAGDLLLIVNGAGTMAMGPQTDYYRSPVAVEPEMDVISHPGKNVAVLTLAGEAGAWRLGVTGGYLSAQSEAKNQLLTVADPTAYALWTIEVDQTGTAVVKAREGSRNRLCYNTRDVRFNCYRSTSDNVTDVTLYHKPVNARSITDREDPGVYLGGRNVRIYTPGTDQQLRSYLGKRLEYVLLNPDRSEQIVVSGYREGMKEGDAATVYILWKLGWHEVLSREYAWTVRKEENGKVWLSDADGCGVIIRK